MLIAPNHPVRLVNQVVDNLKLDPILVRYEGGGCPAYHPRLMLKVLVNGYVTNLYSSQENYEYPENEGIEASFFFLVHFSGGSDASIKVEYRITPFSSLISKVALAVSQGLPSGSTLTYRKPPEGVFEV